MRSGDATCLGFADFSNSVDLQELTLPSSHALEVATVTVDDRCETVFGIPLKWLTRTSKLFATWYAGRGEEKYILAGNPSRLGSVPSQIFCDFARWLHRNRIADPWCVEAPYLVEATARRLVDALDLGIFLDSAEYQLAAMREFLALAPFLEWPEDYVNSIWSVTTNLRNSEAFHHLDNFEKIRLMHPMRQMIVAIVAAKTVGKGKRSVRTGPRSLGVDRGDEITGHIFWVKYNEYRKQQNAEGDDYECAMPERVEWFL
jgi:hypothetical protein